MSLSPLQLEPSTEIIVLFVMLVVGASFSIYPIAFSNHINNEEHYIEEVTSEQVAATGELVIKIKSEMNDKKISNIVKMVRDKIITNTITRITDLPKANEDTLIENYPIVPKISSLEIQDSDLPFDQLRDLEVYDRPDLDITKVSLSHDGEILNAKIWLDGLPQESLSWLTYGVVIDSDANQSTGDSGADFGYYYEYIGDKSLLRENEDSIKSNSWYSVITEFFPMNKYVETRNPVEFTNLDDGMNSTVSFPIDLKDIGNCPEKCSVLFYVADYKTQQYDIVDNTEWIKFHLVNVN